jgi:hypothetical protein
MLRGFDKFECREAGPTWNGLISISRLAFWKIARLFFKLWNLIEIGNGGSGVYTRTFLATAIRKKGK